MSKDLKKVLAIILTISAVFALAVVLHQKLGIVLPDFVIGILAFLALAVAWCFLFDAGDSDDLSGGF